MESCSFDCFGLRIVLTGAGATAKPTLPIFLPILAAGMFVGLVLTGFVLPESSILRLDVFVWRFSKCCCFIMFANDDGFDGVLGGSCDSKVLLFENSFNFVVTFLVSSDEFMLIDFTFALVSVQIDFKSHTSAADASIDFRMVLTVPWVRPLYLPWQKPFLLSQRIDVVRPPCFLSCAFGRKSLH